MIAAAAQAATEFLARKPCRNSAVRWALDEVVKITRPFFSTLIQEAI